MHTWVSVAVLVKTKSLKGGLVARSAPGLPFLLREGLTVAFVPPGTRAPRRARVTFVRGQSLEANYVEFEGVDSIGVAELLVGCSCLARRCDLPLDYAEKPTDTIVGFTVEDEVQGLLGTVVEVIENRAQSIIAVEGERGDILIPYVAAFVRNINSEAQHITTAIPKGLLDA